MLDVRIYNPEGQQTGTVSVEEATLGSRVRPQLLKQAVVMYLANARVGTAQNKGRGQVKGSSRKLYRQKGTGNARMGNLRTPVRRGGGRTFAKSRRDFGKRMPKRMRRLACRNALLARILAEDVMILDGFSLDAPRTQQLKSTLEALGASRGCLLALAEPDAVLLKSSRNIPEMDVIPVSELNAYAVLRRSKVILTRGAFDRLSAQWSDQEATS